MKTVFWQRPWKNQTKPIKIVNKLIGTSSDKWARYGRLSPNTLQLKPQVEKLLIFRSLANSNDFKMRSQISKSPNTPSCPIWTLWAAAVSNSQKMTLTFRPSPSSPRPLRPTWSPFLSLQCRQWLIWIAKQSQIASRPSLYVLWSWEDEGFTLVSTLK